MCRETFIKPNSQWGGNGLLGCDIGYGYLHRIPIIEPGENIISESSDVKSSSSCQTISGCSNKSLTQKPTSIVSLETNQQSNNAILVNPGCQMSNVNLQSAFLNVCYLFGLKFISKNLINHYFIFVWLTFFKTNRV